MNTTYKLMPYAMFSRVTFLLALLFLFCAGNVLAQSVDEEKERAVVEVGAAAFRTVTDDGANSFGPSVAVEITPVKSWLELEFGTTALFRHHSTEWGTDILFKKPWNIPPKVEFMFGIGPEWGNSFSQIFFRFSTAERDRPLSPATKTCNT